MTQTKSTEKPRFIGRKNILATITSASSSGSFAPATTYTETLYQPSFPRAAAPFYPTTRYSVSLNTSHATSILR